VKEWLGFYLAGFLMFDHRVSLKKLCEFSGLPNTSKTGTVSIEWHCESVCCASVCTTYLAEVIITSKETLKEPVLTFGL